MTIDSFYLGAEQFHISRLDEKYTFGYESIGADSFKVNFTYTYVDTGETAYIDVDSSNYYLTYGGEAPIYSRGIITFYNPRDSFVNEDLILYVTRKTPILQELDLIPYTVFPSEQVEFGLDRLTLILQEIDGDKCGCPFGGVSPGGGGVTPPVCVPVSVDTDLTPAISFASVIGTSVTFRATAIGTAPFTYVWKLNSNVIPGATQPEYTAVFNGVNDYGLYSVEITNACGVATSSGQLLEEPCYACDAYPDYMNSINGQYLIAPNGILAGQAVPNGTTLMPGIISSGATGTLTANVPGGGLLDACVDALAWNAHYGGSISGYTSGDVVNASILIQTATMAIRNQDGSGRSDTYSIYAAVPNNEPMPNGPGDGAHISMGVTVTAQYPPSPTGTGYGNATLHVQYTWTASRILPDGTSQAFVQQGGGTIQDAYRFYRGTVGQQYIYPLLFSVTIDATGAPAGQITFSMYASGGYRYNTGEINPAGLIATGNIGEAIDPMITDFITDTSRASGSGFLYPTPTYEGSSINFQDWSVGTNVMSPEQFTESTRQMFRNTAEYGCVVGSGCVPIALTPIYLAVGSTEPDFDIQYFPETLRLTVDKASATTDQTLYEWFFNGVSVLSLWPERNVYEAVITSEAQIGNYSVVATNACGSTEVSQQVTYTPPPCVVIPSAAKIPNTNPNYDFGAYPGDVFMRILPNGGATPPYTYEWYHDGILIDGAVLDNYSAPINDAAGLGVYTAVIRNPCSSAQVSWTYTMTAVCVVPAIPALDPATVDVTAWGQIQSWSVVPTQGDLPMTFTLDRDGTQLEQKNNGSFTVTFNSENDMGVYTVTVSNVCGVVSSSSTVTSSVPGVALPIVSVLPASYDWNGPASDTTQFVATLENPTEAGAVTWYWTFQGTSDPSPGTIPGETTDTLDVLITSEAQVGTYRAYATNAAGESLPGVGAIVNVAAVPPIIDAGPDGTFQYGGDFPPPVIQLAGTSIPGTDPAPTYYWTIVSGITDNNLTTWSDRTSLTTTVQFGNYTRPNGTQFILALTATTNDTSQVVDIVIYTKTGF